VTDPLFAALPGPVGPLRALVDARVAELAGADLPADLVLVVQSLADRVDAANATRQFRGFVMLTAEYRAARRDLFDGRDDTGPDPIDVALAAFRAAEADDAAGSHQAH
jgi:hypothetical protein